MEIAMYSCFYRNTQFGYRLKENIFSVVTYLTIIL